MVAAVSRRWDGQLQQVPVEPEEWIRGRVGGTVRVTPGRRTSSAILEFWTRGSVAWFACTAWNEVAKNASLRP
jgi:hypothetical protein